MKLFKHIIISFALLLLSILPFNSLQARTIVLVHGFMADDMSWRYSGFTQPLLQAGWKDGGGYGYGAQGILFPRDLMTKGDVFYTVNLPSKANLQIQESYLMQYLSHLYAYRFEPMTLVGHSAGGLIARLYVIDPQREQAVNGLITIASPHLGTPAANIAHLAGNSPIGMMASMAGISELQDSRGLFSDLKEEAPYNFLYWMNRQHHPNIHYASIIRKNDSITQPERFDFVVPPFSQDMNNIWALRERSGIALSTENHSLNGKDGVILLQILQHIPLSSSQK
ncbi:alpha/beta hydrolase [Cocleimonas sp. KMM 6892]|uniref:esterase/lipase family protein n=1 Tax=unclassified Cocleimonas TaxID=2639732 RepID=UPI002DB84615|nr:MULTISPECIES: alpha/beta hydrolase [unclassified Cocleimonas]MEB8432877.1 alpha/beta hydrolase [Cocleimonas sp. KMM 6892]MEC4715736.1 alpha/beta hydrolase [Cocleimonas sp. KMM 6895]MEC4744646.1 alpha/beta hydrolase [Cocleimonas sp. KMM 6896]